MTELNYNIISSGSKGNCVIIENIMIDMGVPYKSIKDEMSKIDTLLLTHKHSDHYRKSNLKHFRKKVIIAPTLLAAEIVQYFNANGLNFKKVIAVDHDDGHLINGTEIGVFRCYHNVQTVGYAFEINKNKIIYATDTKSTIDFKKDKYDYIFIESNYDEKKLKRALENERLSPRAAMNLRHLSKTKALKFYLENSHKDTKFIELHKSEKFY